MNHDSVVTSLWSKFTVPVWSEQNPHIELIQVVSVRSPAGYWQEQMQISPEKDRVSPGPGLM